MLWVSLMSTHLSGFFLPFWLQPQKGLQSSQCTHNMFSVPTKFHDKLVIDRGCKGLVGAPNQTDFLCMWTELLQDSHTGLFTWILQANLCRECFVQSEVYRIRALYTDCPANLISCIGLPETWSGSPHYWTWHIKWKLR
jgi:hypothetical protein